MQFRMKKNKGISRTKKLDTAEYFLNILLTGKIGIASYILLYDAALLTLADYLEVMLCGKSCVGCGFE